MLGGYALDQKTLCRKYFLATEGALKVKVCEKCVDLFTLKRESGKIPGIVAGENF